MTMMTITENLAFRWIKRYKVFFFIGVLILCLQVFLAYKSLVLNELNVFVDKSQANEVHRTYPLKSLVSLEPTPVTNIEGLQYVPSQDNQQLTNSLDIQPECEIKSKETLSALQRAKTKECRKLISDTACAIESGYFYAKDLPTYCPNGNYTKNLILGCYQDQKDKRLLTGYFTNLKTTNSPIKCNHLCLQSGFPYAGVQYKTECFCGDESPPNHAKLPDSSCNMKCSGDSKEVCGGFYTMNVYETGIAKFRPKTTLVTPDENEERVKIAFLLTLNGRALRQIHRLIKALYSKNHVFFIHVDARQNYLYRNLLELEKIFPNVHVTNKRFSTIWGGASLLTMLLQCMEDLLTSTSWQWDFVINLSESDFPIKTMDTLVDFLTANKGRNFVKSHGRETQRFIQKQGLDKTFVECDTHMWRIGDRKLPNGIQIDGGSDWIALSRNFSQYIISRKDEDVLLQGLIKIFNHTLLPAESFFHTVLRNSVFCDTYVDNNLHVTNWKRKLGCKCQYKHVVDWCGCSPNDFRSEDWKRLKGTSNKNLFFARKFEPVINQKILLQVEEWIYGPYSMDYINLQGYWQSFYNSEDEDLETNNDLLMTIGDSLTRLISKRLSLKEKQLSEMTHYFYQDQYKGFLIRFYVSKENVTFELESRVKPIQYTKIAKNSNFAKRLRNLEVSSDFDQKEQISRNFAKMLGPFSEPTVIFTFLGATHNSEIGHHSYNLTILWIDPFGKLQDFNELHIEDSQTDTIYFSKSSIKQPVTPGIWTMKLIGRTFIYAQTKFIISPLALYHRKPVTSIRAAKLNNGSLPNFPSDFIFPAEWHQFLPNLNEVNMFLEVSKKSHLIGTDLHKWVDDLVGKFYHFREICNINAESNIHSTTVALAAFPLCRETTWSSQSPDPKSDVKLLLK